MKSEDYTHGDAFQSEKRTLFAAEWLPLCAEGQVANAGDFLSATVGGWGVFGVRDREGAVRVLRNACRHQNMQVVGTPSGNCGTFRCRFHGWTYDLRGRFLGAPPPVAPKDPESPELHLRSLSTSIASGVVFFSLATPAQPLSKWQYCSGLSPASGAVSNSGSFDTTSQLSSICWPNTCRRRILAGTGRCSRYAAPER